MKVFETYFPRVIISLLDGQWQTAPQIARNWEGQRGKGTTNDTPYRKECDSLVGNHMLRSRSLYPDSRRKSDREYHITSRVSQFLGHLWGVKAKDVPRIMELSIFHDTLRTRRESINKKDAKQLLWNLYAEVSKQIMEKSAKNEQKLLAEIRENSFKAKLPTPLQIFDYLQQVHENEKGAKRALKYFNRLNEKASLKHQ